MEEDHFLCRQVREIQLGSFCHLRPGRTINMCSHGSSKVQHMKDAGAQGYPHHPTNQPTNQSVHWLQCIAAALALQVATSNSSDCWGSAPPPPSKEVPPTLPSKKRKRCNLWYDDKVKVSCAGESKQPLFILRGTQRNAVSLEKMSHGIWWLCEKQHLSYHSLFFQTLWEKFNMQGSLRSNNAMTSNGSKR